MEKDKMMIPMIDPMNGSNLRRQEDGTFLSEGTGKTFTFDASRKAFIPNYLPEEELGFEDAHIEGDYLVGNHTGKRFLIDQNGEILTDEKQKFLVLQKKLKQQYRDKIENQVQKIQEASQKETEKVQSNSQTEIEKIRDEGFFKAWKIEHGIENMDQTLEVDSGAYFQKTKEVLQQFETEPLVVKGTIQNGKCYYVVGLPNSGTHPVIQANIFPYDIEFKKNFLEPLLQEVLQEESPLFMQVTPNEENSSVASFRLLQKNGTTLFLQNIETSYAERLESMALSPSNGKEENTHSLK